MTIDVFNFVAVALNGVTLIGVSLWIPLDLSHMSDHVFVVLLWVMDIHGKLHIHNVFQLFIFYATLK